MLTGDNGILTRAGEAKERTDEEQIIEEARMDILSTQATKLTDALTEAELEGILSPKYGTLSTEERTIDKKLTTTDGKYVIPVSKIYNGELKVSLPTIADADEKNYYGNFIDYDVDLDGTTNDYDWKIFYNDGTNIYIIAEDYVPTTNTLLGNVMTSIGAKTDTKTDYPYSVYWDYNNGNIQCNTYKNGTILGAANGAADIFTNRPIGTAFLEGKGLLKAWKEKTTTSEYSNAKMTASLMDTKAWEGFAGGTLPAGVSGTSYAIGGPTLEMWVESWKKMHGASSDDASTEGASALELYYASNATGYFVGTSANPETSSSYYAYQSGTTGYTDTLYYPHPLDSNGNPDTFTTTNNCYGYWLASPSACDPYYVMDVYYDGYVTNGGFYDAIYGVRPVVCLPSDITASWNKTDEVWNIIKK